MEVRIKRIDKSLPLPKFETSGAVGFDIYTRIDAKIMPKEIVKLPSNLIIETPDDYMLMMASRSSLPTKVGLTLANAVGVFDNDFCGDKDEMIMQLYNLTDKPVEVKRGDRLAQGIFVRVDKAEWNETNEMNNINRGGIGTTGRAVKTSQ